MDKELKYLSEINLNANLVILLGGAKVSTKLAMIKYFLNKITLLKLSFFSGRNKIPVKYPIRKTILYLKLIYWSHKI